MFNVGAAKYDETNLSNTISQEAAYKWKGKVGLINLSDYVKASTNSACDSVNAYRSSSSCYNSSETHNWIFAVVVKIYSWTIAPCSYSHAGYVVSVGSDGGLDIIIDYSSGAAPVLYLSSNISLGGEGTSDNPYTVE